MKTTRAAGAIALALAAAAVPAPAFAGDDFESLEKGSELVYDLMGMLRPFVATCDRETDHFRQLFCSALNERLKAQHQSKLYRITEEPSIAGPLIVRFKAKPKPQMEVEVRGCLTCKEPMLDREGGDISKARFFLFKTPKEIKLKRGKVLYDLGDIDVASYKIDLPKTMTEKTFNEEVLTAMRLEFLFRPVAGVVSVGGGKYSYGVLNFELVGHRVFNRCSGEVPGSAPKTTGKIALDKTDMTCVENRPKVEVKIVLPTEIPRAKVKELLGRVADDLHTCHEQFGAMGDVPTEVMVSPSGVVKSAKVSGDLKETPTAACVERLVKAVVFPKFQGEEARINWPFTLRN
jgi:hypothetical protein